MLKCCRFKSWYYCILLFLYKQAPSHRITRGMDPGNTCRVLFRLSPPDLADPARRATSLARADRRTRPPRPAGPRAPRARPRARASEGRKGHAGDHRQYRCGTPTFARCPKRALSICAWDRRTTSGGLCATRRARLLATCGHVGTSSKRRASRPGRHHKASRRREALSRGTPGRNLQAQIRHRFVNFS